jgi:two-component system CheB/CheR fusion protein
VKKSQQGKAGTSPSRSKTLPSSVVRPGRDSQENFLVVALGASAGGLAACRDFVSGLPDGVGMAFILIQHLDPTHESHMVDLLAGHTSMKVMQATEGMPLERDHFYVIPPGVDLTVAEGVFHISPPQLRHGLRMPIDFFLHSLATDFEHRAVCVILSGTGSDGSAGLKSIKEKGGLVIAENPDEAAYDGMPRSAVMTGAVDHVLSLSKIPAALVKYYRGLARARAPKTLSAVKKDEDRLPAIIELLFTKTKHDFRLYKQGTLSRRIERRMALAAMGSMEDYLDLLERDSGELDLLVKDLLINVTSFFRDPNVFDLLTGSVLPDLIRRTNDRALRIWIAGCSTGEEAYSVAMLLRETITALNLDVKLQIFASDVDPDAIAFAREGHYPSTIEADVSAERLGRFFTKEDQGYRILPELRSQIVFTVQDLLSDPPFASLDLVSCRNLLIYLLPEAQAKIIALFHFALKDSGILLLGHSETAGDIDGRFEVVAKAARIYRHLGHATSRGVGFFLGATEGGLSLARRRPDETNPRPAALADLCRRMVQEAYAPATVLITLKSECLYSLGPTDRYLRVAPGHATHDLFSMTPPDLHAKLRSAIRRASQDKARVVVTGAKVTRDGASRTFNIEVHPVPGEANQLLMVCFIEDPGHTREGKRIDASDDAPGAAGVEHELEATRTELQDAMHELERSIEEQKTVSEEASSINEEFQATNEELLASKEELQSLNEELTALNTQLQETLERQRTTSGDLENVLNSTDVATLFLDLQLNIRLFTPATRLLFSIIPGDVGRPLADLNSLAADSALVSDAETVLRTLAPVEREIEARTGSWYIRRILPYRSKGNVVAGVVITFVDITARRHVSDALEEARRQAQQANVTKSRFLAAASHDLRQPLQTLSLLQGLLARSVSGEREKKIVARINETLFAMSGILNALLDINQIEAGMIRPDIVKFPINDILNRLKSEFDYHAKAKALALRVVPCGLSVQTDPRLLEQMMRNLLANALKYTKQGRALLGCRRLDGKLSIEIWDTGIGIPEKELQAIFDEYHQIDNPARERGRGLGLGLSIVHRLGVLLDHRIQVHSTLGKGSVFAIEVPLAPGDAAVPSADLKLDTIGGPVAGEPRRNGVVLVVEDDPNVLEALELLLRDEDYIVAAATDGVEALKLIGRGALQPDVILTDYNLPNGMNGLEVTLKLRERLHVDIPAIILTGDISTDTLRDIAVETVIQLNKPVNNGELLAAIQSLLPISGASSLASETRSAVDADDTLSQVICVVDDDRNVRDMLRAVLEEDGHIVEDFETCEAFLGAYQPGRGACLLVDAYLPGMSGLQLLQRLDEAGHRLPAIMMTGGSDVSIAVEAMKAGASDFIEKPVSRGDLLVIVGRALEQSRDSAQRVAWHENSAKLLASLTARQREILNMVLAGHPSKNIAADLGISQRTVENHRATIMKKTGSKSLPALARLAVAAR